MSSLKKVHCDTLTNFLVKQFTFTITYVDHDIAGKRVGNNITRLFSWHWPGDDELILPIVISIVNSTILSIVNSGITGLADFIRKTREFCGCQWEDNGEGGPFAGNVTPIFDNNIAAEWVQAVMK